MLIVGRVNGTLIVLPESEKNVEVIVFLYEYKAY